METRRLFFLFLCLSLATSTVLGQGYQDQTGSVKRIASIKDYVRDNGYKYKTIALNPDQVYIFPGINGPKYETVIPYRKPTSWRNFSSGSDNRLCILLVDTTSNWLGLVNGFNSNAIPFKITTDVNQALKHKVVVVYPSVSSQNIDYDTYNKLRNFPESGGALIGFDLRAPSMGQIFGYKETSFNNNRYKIKIDPTSSNLVSFCITSLEREIRVGNPKVSPVAYETCAFIEPEYKPLAIYDDGSGAIIQKLYNNGIALAIGLDLGHFSMLAYFNYDSEYQNTISNGFEPTLDVFYQIIKQTYLKYAKYPVMFGTVPDNRMVSVLITHDVDTKDAVPYSLIYADVEYQAGIKATYNIQTKYIKDGQDDAFFTHENLKYFTTLKKMGMEISSHSVSHTPFFNFIPMGSGKENYPSYQPFYVTNFNTFNESLLGELRVSKYLLDNLIGTRTISWRSGYLDYAPNLHKAMEQVGYRYSSSVLANDVLTHMPFQALYDDHFNQLLDVYEVPVTIEDEELPPMYQRLGQASFVTEQVARYGGVVNILIHPNVIDGKVDFLKEYIDLYKNSAWFGTMSEFGDFFRGRIRASLDVREEFGQLSVSIIAPNKIFDLPVLIPPGFQFMSINPGGIKIREEAGCIVIKELTGPATIILRR